MNVAKTAVELLDNLETRFPFCKLTWEGTGIWHKEYALFQLHPQQKISLCDDEFIYKPPMDQIHDGINILLETTFVGCDVTYNKNTHEVEVLGNRYRKFHKSHADAIEALAEEHNWWIYEG